MFPKADFVWTVLGIVAYLFAVIGLCIRALMTNVICLNADKTFVNI